MPNGNLDNNIAEFEQDLKQKCPKDDKEEKCQADNPFVQSTKVLDNVAFHDFAFYEYLLDPSEGYSKWKLGLSNRGLQYLDQLENLGLPTEALNAQATFLEVLEDTIKEVVVQSNLTYVEWDKWINYMIDTLYLPNANFNYIDILSCYYWTAEPRSRFILDLEWSLNGYLYLRINGSRQFDWLEWYTNASDRGGLLDNWRVRMGGNIGHVEALETRAMLEQMAYNFEVFPSYSVNVGLRLVYRQEWKPLGMQPGEIVRTIPLGPGQKERITTKIIRRTKRTSTMESSTETEATTESTESAKDSNEIVAEAADSFNWKVDAEIHGGFGDIIGGSASTSFGGSSEDKSKRTSSHLSETMQKTASKIRRQTKVVVSTESEETFETERFSEISNPNNEIAITYEYMKMQQQYEVFTSLAEVQSVIFVAEYLPTPSEINKDWVRKHDWIIAKVLKDESYRQTLNELIQDVDEDQRVVGEENFGAMLGTAYTKFASFQPNTVAGGASGLTVPDIYAEPQRLYKEHLQEVASRNRTNNLRNIKRNRFYEHIRDNILHYCQAIWSHEDSEQRILRYKKENRRVPIEWTLPTVIGAVPTGKDAALWELIDPTGPVGYVGNYAVFGLLPLPESDVPAGYFFEIISLNELMKIKREDYVDGKGKLLDPALASYVKEAERDHHDDYSLKKLSDSEVRDFLSYLPHLWNKLIGKTGELRRDHGYLKYKITTDEWGEYLYRKNGTRRFLVDSNNLYLNIRASSGAALEPFKRAHRYIDVLKEYENLIALRMKNERRETHMQQTDVYDPDIEKVIIVDDADSLTAHHAALHDAMSTTPGAPVTPPAPEVTPVTTPTTTPAPSGGTTPSTGGGVTPS